LNAGDTALSRAMVKRAGVALRYQRTNGMVEEAGHQGAAVLWGITPP